MYFCRYSADALRVRRGGLTAATCPLITPAITIVGIATPYAIFSSVLVDALSAGEVTSAPVYR